MEVRITDPETGVYHIADVYLDGWVIELQHSYLPQADIEKRERFYTKHAEGMIWVTDRQNFSGRTSQPCFNVGQTPKEPASFFISFAQRAQVFDAALLVVMVQTEGPPSLVRYLKDLEKSDLERSWVSSNANTASSRRANAAANEEYLRAIDALEAASLKLSETQEAHRRALIEAEEARNRLVDGLVGWQKETSSFPSLPLVGESEVAFLAAEALKRIREERWKEEEREEERKERKARREAEEREAEEREAVFKAWEEGGSERARKRASDFAEKLRAEDEAARKGQFDL